MGRHAKPKKRSPLGAIIAVIIILAAALVLLSNLPQVSDSLKGIPGLGAVVEALDFTADTAGQPDEVPDVSLPTESTVRLNFKAEQSDTGAPVYLIHPGVAPNRLEFTLYDVQELDMEEISAALSSLDCVEDVYSTIVMDHSVRRFTVELSEDITWDASEYNPDGYVDLTVTNSGYSSDDSMFIVRSESSSMDEDMAALAEEIADFSPSIVKTRSGEYCLVAGACSDEEEAQGLLEQLPDDFFIEECTVFSNPE